MTEFNDGESSEVPISRTSTKLLDAKLEDEIVLKLENSSKCDDKELTIPSTESTKILTSKPIEETNDDKTYNIESEEELKEFAALMMDGSTIGKELVTTMSELKDMLKELNHQNIESEKTLTTEEVNHDIYENNVIDTAAKASQIEPATEGEGIYSLAVNAEQESAEKQIAASNVDIDQVRESSEDTTDFDDNTIAKDDRSGEEYYVRTDDTGNIDLAATQQFMVEEVNMLTNIVDSLENRMEKSFRDALDEFEETINGLQNWRENREINSSSLLSSIASDEETETKNEGTTIENKNTDETGEDIEETNLFNESDILANINQNRLSQILQSQNASDLIIGRLKMASINSSQNEEDEKIMNKARKILQDSSESDSYLPETDLGVNVNETKTTSSKIEYTNDKTENIMEGSTMDIRNEEIEQLKELQNQLDNLLVSVEKKEKEILKEKNTLTDLSEDPLPSNNLFSSKENMETATALESHVKSNLLHHDENEGFSNSIRDMEQELMGFSSSLGTLLSQMDEIDKEHSKIVNRIKDEVEKEGDNNDNGEGKQLLKSRGKHEKIDGVYEDIDMEIDQAESEQDKVKLIEESISLLESNLESMDSALTSLNDNINAAKSKRGD